MSGPRVTSGEDSKQDYSTPADFMGAVRERLGAVQFDLAAHSGNKQHPRYFAPVEFVEEGPLVSLGVVGVSVLPDNITFVKKDKKGIEIFRKVTKNLDKECYALDAFKHEWHALSKKFPAPGGGPGLLWLNCEFNDISPWAGRCLSEMKKGANIALLTPLMVANWNRDLILGRADVYDLSGRLCFDGKNVYPKDCQLAHYHPKATGRRLVWEWKANKIHHEWSLIAPA